MKKITFIQRLFWSSKKICDYILEGQSGDNIGAVKEQYEARLEERQKSLDEKNKQITKLDSKIIELEKTIREHLANISYKENDARTKETQIGELREQVTELQTKLSERAKESENLKTDISKKLETIGKIERTFFADTGNKGVGELGERQVKTVLEKAGFAKDMWTENLLVGSKSVEFAIKSAEDGKWIPVDSKVLKTDIEDGKVVVDKKYCARVATQAKEVAGYLNKKNTAGYGILVLQSDSIYLEMYNLFPQFFQEVLRDHKIHIASPSSFVQMAWSISQIIDIYERIHGDEDIYKDMISTLDSVANFANSLGKVHKDFNIAMVKHFSTIENKHSSLTKKLEKSGKMKDIKLLNNKESE